MLTIHRIAAPEPGDFCWGIEGELAVPSPVVCERRCGCERAHSGMSSCRASTTLKVRKVEIALEHIVDLGVGWLEQTGWADGLGRERTRELAEQIMDGVAEEAAQWSEGTILRPFYRRSTADWVYVEAVSS